MSNTSATTLEAIMAALEELFHHDLSDTETTVDQVKVLMAKYVSASKMLDDPFYLRRTVLWMIDMMTARAREGKKLAGVGSVPAATMQIYDRAYQAVCELKMDQEGQKVLLESCDRMVSQAVDVPKFDMNEIFKEVQEMQEADGSPATKPNKDDKDPTGPGRLVIARG